MTYSAELVTLACEILGARNCHEQPLADAIEAVHQAGPQPDGAPFDEPRRNLLNLLAAELEREPTRRECSHSGGKRCVAVDATGREINPGDFVRYIDDDDGFFPGIYRVQRIECGGIRIFLFDSGWQWLRSLWFFTGATPTEAAHRRSEFLDRSAHGAAAGVVVTRGDAA